MTSLPALAIVLCLAAPLAAHATCTDADGDGFSPDGAGCGLLDCNDAAPGVFPGAPERCNGADDDCDLTVDEDPDASASCASSCTATAVCQSGACVTTPLVCDDGNACTQDACQPGTGCVFTAQPNGLSCSDGNPCTGEEVCQNGACGNAPDLVCNDGNACTQDSCAPPNGCRNTPVPGCCVSNADCVDASACTTNERCEGGACISDPVVCDDGEPCTSDSCSPATGCRNVAIVNGIACGDGDVCNGLETCQSGLCTSGAPPACDDGSPCTVDGCDSLAGCTVQELPGCCASDADCADVSACTVNERCVGNACLSDPLPCNDANPCTSDGCNALTGCTFTPLPNGQSCGDLDFCDGFETCQAGACAAGTAPQCDDGNPCTDDACNSLTGCTHTAVPDCCFTDGDCVDADACTIDERCVSGSCTSTPRNCNDGNVCTADSCVPASGCVHHPLLDSTSCTDGAACDGLETCASGTCVEGSPPVCDDRNFCTVDACNNASGCTHAAVPGCCNVDAECADANLCTVAERCLSSHVCASDPRSCVDGNPCTSDGCNAASGCVHVPASAPCSDGLACTENDACNAGQCQGSPIACGDGNHCDGAEVCAPASGTCVEGEELPCLPGGRSPIAACTGEWYVDAPLPPNSVRAVSVACAEGDPACDHDTSPDICTFRLAICLRIADPRLPGCFAAPVSGYMLPRSLLRKAPGAATALLSALASLPGATIAGDFGNEILFAPAVAAARCTELAAVAVPVGRRLALKGRITTEGGRPDKDRLKLSCL